MEVSTLTERKPSQIVDDNFAALVLAIAAHGNDSDVVAQLTVENLQEFAPFRIDRIYCCKTGHDIGARDLRRIASMVDRFGETKAIELLPYLLQTAVDMPWLKTDAEALDAHEIHDPIGYFVYSAAHACAIHYGDYNRVKREWKSPEARMRYFADMIALNTQLQAMPVDEIRERNGIWRVYHKLILPQFAPLPTKRLCDYVLPDVWSALAGDIKTALLAFARKNHESFNPHNFRRLYEDQLAYEAAHRIRPGDSSPRGNSSYGKQKRYKPTTIVSELKLFSDLERGATNAVDQLFAQFGVAGSLNAFGANATTQQTKMPTGGFTAPTANSGLTFTEKTLEAATAPEPANVARESFTSLARKLSSKVEGAAPFKLVLGKKG